MIQPAMQAFKLKKALLLIGDIALLYGALFITLKLRYFSGFDLDLWSRHVTPFSLVFIIWIIVFFINNLYTSQLVKNDFKFYSYLLQNLVIILLIGFTFFYLAPSSLTSSLTPFRVLIVQVLVFGILLVGWRHLFYRFTSSKKLSNNTLFIGLNREAIELASDLMHNPPYGFRPAAIIDPLASELPENLVALPRYREITDLQSILSQHSINTVVTVRSSEFDAEISRYLFETLGLGLNYYRFPDFYEKITGKIPVASLEKSWFLENLLAGNKRWYEFFKRIQDILFSIVFGILSLILILFVIAGVKLSSPGPILFKQVRVGKGGKHFTAMKFRTMPVDAEKDGPQWASKNDQRAGAFGRFLRKTRLDEIPQFFNILKGDMTFVGPRPERPEFISTLSQQIPYYNERLLVKPGLSGWAQINFKYGESVKDAMTKLQYDLFYIKNRSFALDLSIVLKTIRIVLGASLGQ